MVLYKISIHLSHEGIICYKITFIYNSTGAVNYLYKFDHCTMTAVCESLKKFESSY